MMFFQPWFWKTRTQVLTQVLVPHSHTPKNNLEVFCKAHFTKETVFIFTVVVSNSQGRNLGCSVTSARTSGFSSTQGDLGESVKGIFTSQSN